MDYQTDQPGWKRVLALTAKQSGLVTRQQLLALGLSAQGIKHRVARGKLHPIYRGESDAREDEPEVLERWTLTLTDTQLERRFIPIARRVGLGDPLTRQWLNGCRVDFFFSDLGIVVEADGPRYYRTAARQTADARRDRRHAAAGLTPLRFSHAQITYHPDEVEDVLRRVAARIRLASGDQA